MKRFAPLVLSVAATACTPPPPPVTPPKPVPPLPAAAPAALRLDVDFADGPDGALVAVGKVVNTGSAPVQVGRELRLSYQFEPNDVTAAGAPKFGGNPFTPSGQPGFVALPPSVTSTRTLQTPAAVREQLVLAKPSDRPTMQDGRLRVTAQVSVLPAGASPAAIEPREVTLVSVVEFTKPRGAVGNSAEAER